MTNEEMMQLMTDMGLHEGGMENWVHDNAWLRVANRAIEIEREAVLQTIEALYDTQDPNPMYQEGYNHALDNLKEFVKARGQE